MGATGGDAAPAMMELWTGFALGLVGGVHCAGMCGPLALALPVPEGGRGRFVLGRLIYQGGRLLTYAGLGLVVGLVGRTLWMAGLQRWASIGLGVLLLAGLVGSRRLALAKPVMRLLGRLQSMMAGYLKTRTLGALAVLGMLNGLLPCGLVYVACAGAVATGGLGSGAAYMLAFGLGTVPVMLAISLSGKLISVPVRQRLVRWVPVSVGVLAALLIVRGLGLGIPYLSPDLASGQAACCGHAATP